MNKHHINAESINDLLHPKQSWQKPGFPDYALTNNNAVIRWAKTLKDYDPNNETMRSFGRRNNFNSHQGSYWYKRFREKPEYKKAFLEICRNLQNFDESIPHISSIECIEITPPIVTDNIIIERKDWKIHIPGYISSDSLKKIVVIIG